MYDDSQPMLFTSTETSLKLVLTVFTSKQSYCFVVSLNKFPHISIIVKKSFNDLIIRVFIFLYIFIYF